MSSNVADGYTTWELDAFTETPTGYNPRRNHQDQHSHQHSQPNVGRFQRHSAETAALYCDRVSP